MASPYGKDIFTQAYQSRPPNFQPGPTNQDPNYAQSSAQSNFIDPPPPYQPASRPHSIAELAEISKQSLGDEARPFKTWLRIAENARRDAKAFREQGNLELAFVEYAKAAAIVLERVPLHPEYRVLLSPTQRHNMGLVSYICPMVSTAVRLVIHVPMNGLMNELSVVLSNITSATLVWSLPSKRRFLLAGWSSR